jgi:plastocyanin
MWRAGGAPVLVALALSLGLVATGCAEEEPSLTAGGGGDDQDEGHEERGTVSIAGQEATNRGSKDVAGVGEVELELDDFYFSPTVLEGEAGQTLTVTMHNEGDAPHTFTVDDVDVDQELQPGDEGVSAEVTFPDSGALVFYCRFHRDGGMLGALSVGGDLTGPPGGPGGSGGTESDDSPPGGYNY